jgi:hypothetical protein
MRGEGSMAWEKYGERRYYYRSVRRDGQVKKLYYGAGPTGQLAAAVDALRRAERQAEEAVRRAARDRLDAALALTRDLSRGCELLAAATLLAAGLHRPSRHPWRIWRDGHKVLKHDSP